jgi:hypothetical protein
VESEQLAFINMAAKINKRKIERMFDFTLSYVLLFFINIGILVVFDVILSTLFSYF